MQPYLVTGGQGFIGSKIIKKINGTSYDVKSHLDILDTQTLLPFVENCSGVFHLAALISVPESIEKPEEYYQTNVVGTRSVISAVEQHQKKIIFSSSAAVYGEASSPVTEEDTLNPKSPYAENKRDAEELLQNAKTPAIALRYFNIYGPGQSAAYAGVITHFILNALQGKDLHVYGDGNQVRDFVFVDDIVEANILAMQYNNDTFEVFNIGSGVETTINTLAETIIRLTESSSKIIHEDARQGDIVYSQADTSKAKERLGFVARIGLEEGLKETISWYKQQL